jgi:hypothetical protein
MTEPPADAMGLWEALNLVLDPRDATKIRYKANEEPEKHAQDVARRDVVLEKMGEKLRFLDYERCWRLFGRLASGEWACWGRRQTLLGPLEQLPSFEGFWRAIQPEWDYNTLILKEPGEFPLMHIRIGANVVYSQDPVELREVARWVDCMVAIPAVPRGARRLQHAAIQGWLRAQTDWDLAPGAPATWPSRSAVWQRAAMELPGATRAQVFTAYQMMAERAGIELPDRGQRNSRLRA